MIMTEEQKRKYNIFTGELQDLLTVSRDERTEVKYYIKENGAEIVEIYDKHGHEIAKTDVTSMSLMVAAHSILVMLIHG